MLARSRIPTIIREALLLGLLLTPAVPPSGQSADQDPITEAPPASENVRTLDARLLADPAAAIKAPAPDEVFGTYDGYNLDQYLGREQGPIVFPVYLTRVFSKNRRDYGDLLMQPQLVIRAWDVDSFCGNACNGLCEIDNVYLNGNYLGRLSGATGTWSESRFDIPTAWFDQGKVNDALYNGPGTPPTPEPNWVAIDIDVQTVCHWKVRVDFGEVWARASGRRF